MLNDAMRIGGSVASSAVNTGREGRTKSARRRVLSAALASLAGCGLALSANPASGATDTWDNTSTDSLWNTTSGNWTILAAPGQPFANGDAVIFDAAGAGAITVDPGGVSAASLTFNAAGVGYTFGGGAITLTGALTDNATSGTNTINSALIMGNGGSLIANTNASSILTLGAVTAFTSGGLTFSGAGTTNVNGALSFNSSSDSLITGVVNSSGGGTTGTANLQIRGGGSFTISGGTFNASTITAISNLAAATGSMTVSGGIYNQTAGALGIGYSAGTGGTLTVGGTGTVNVNAGTLNLGLALGNNGTLNLNAGGTFNTAVQFTVGAATANVVNFNGGTLGVTSAAAATNLFGGTAANVAVNILQGGAIFNTAGNTVTITNVLAHGGTGTGDTLTVSGTAGGLLTLTGANTFSGGLTVNSGATVATSVAGGLGAGGVTNNGTINLTAGNITPTGLSTSLSGSGIINVTLGTTTQTTALNGNYSAFTGTWNIGTGPGGKAQMNGLDNSAATINVLTGGTLFVGTNALTHNASIVLNGQTAGGTLGENLGQLRIESNAIWAGQVTLAGASTSGMIGSNSGSATISGNIVETGGARLLNKTGAGTIILSGTNTFTGGTTVTGGGLVFGKLSALPSTGAIVAASGTTLGVNAGGTGQFGSADITALLGRSTFGVVATAATFQIDTTNATLGTFTYSDPITDGTGKLSLQKIGAGTLVLTNTSTYSGTTPISVGTLALGPGGNLGSTQVNIANGATLAVRQNASGTTNTIGNATFTLNSGGAINMADGFISTLTNTGAVTFRGATGPAATITLDITDDGSITTLDKFTSAAGFAVGVGGVQIAINPIAGNTSLHPGTYPILTGTGGLGGGSLNLSSNKITVGTNQYLLSLAGSTPTTEQLTVTASTGAAAAYWTGAQGSNWSDTSAGLTNWNTTVAGGADLRDSRVRQRTSSSAPPLRRPSI